MKQKTVILGISCFYHDSAAALVVNGEVVAAAEEERFSRKKHDSGFPSSAVNFCLAQGKVSINQVDYVVFYEKPLQKFERLLQTYIRTWPYGLFSFLKAMREWLTRKLWIEHAIRKHLRFSGHILYVEHHYAHAASAYYCSPFQKSAIVTMDGVGEWDTTTLGFGDGNTIRLTHSIVFPHSLGLLYSALTYYLGFTVNSDEYKVMGLAPYGNPEIYYKKFLELITWKNDGSFKLNMSYFSYEYGLTMTNARFNTLFGAPPRKPESALTQREKDIAAALQKITEEIILKIFGHAREICGSTNVCLAGGVALNCVANGKILASKIFDNIYIQPASGDAGGAVGAALYVFYDVLGNTKKGSAMPNVFLGPAYTDKEIKLRVGGEIQRLAEIKKISFKTTNESQLYDEVAALIEGNTAVGWFQGRMEFGPRALGNRSILADPRNKDNWQKINLKIKNRESFRPFAPVVMEEHVQKYFHLPVPSPYMLFVAPVVTDAIPAVTHVDGSARVQTVSEEQNEKLYKLLRAFYKRTGCSVLVNTSFNVRNEPIVMSPEDALYCFLNTEMDYLVIGNTIVAKNRKLL